MENIDNVISENINKCISKMIKESLRQKMEKCVTESEDVIKRFYNVSANGHKPIMVEHITIDRVINKHGKDGFIIISANSEGVDQETNDINAKKLLSNIQRSGYSFLPTYGGYKEPDWKEASYEPSFVVFNNNYNNEWKSNDFKELFELGKTWCAEFNQFCFLAKAPNEPAKYYDKDGHRTTVRETDTVYKNDPKQKVFTTFHTPEQDKKFGIGRRWTHDLHFPSPDEEIKEYVNPIPCTIPERLKRKGEVMIY